MKLLDSFITTRIILLGVITLVFLVGCDQSANQANLKYNQDLEKQEKKASLVELRSCFTMSYLQAEDRDLSPQEIAKRIRNMCADEFTHLRAVKFQYAPVPDINTPPPGLVDEELGLVERFIEKSRVNMDEIYQKFHQPNSERWPESKPQPRQHPNLPPGHPPIAPHQYDFEHQKKNDGV